jgi:hypothetical protein
MAKSEHYSEPLHYWILGMPYLRLAEGCCAQIVAARNPLTESTPRSGIDWIEYDDQLVWSGHGIGIPVLFSFYHGIELLLKGFVAVYSPVPSTHSLTRLLEMVAERHPESDFVRLVEEDALGAAPYAPVGRFLKKNGLTIDSWYEALRYPESKQGRVFDQLDIKFGGLHLWESVGRTAAALADAADDLAVTTGLT